MVLNLQYFPLSHHFFPATWLRSLVLRPLLALAAVAFTGCALGFALANAWNVAWLHVLPELALPLLLIVFHGAALWMSRLRVRALPLCWTILIALWTIHAAQRVTPAPDDVSQMVRRAPDFSQPQRKTAVTLQGTIADAPRIGDFGIEFPLQINRVLDKSETAAQGRVWIRLPLSGKTLNEGDEISLQAALADLPRAGNFGERESRARLVAARCWCLAQVKKDADWKLVRASKSSLSHILSDWRRTIANRYDASFIALGEPFPRASSQLLVAMVFGEGGLREPLPSSTRDRFRAAGMSHLLVASGTQVAFLALALLGGAKLIGLRRIGLLLLVLPILLLYALLTGGASSIWRATLAGACVAWALLLGRDVDGLSLWSLAAVVLLALDPMQAQDLGFQLTFGATWGLLVLSPLLQKTLRHAWGQSKIIEAAALTLSAQMATTPLLLYHFGRLSFVALGANFLAIPLAGVLVGSGVLGLILPIGALNYWLIRGVDNLATFASSAPGAQSDAPPLRLGWTIFAYGLLLLALLSTQFPMNRNFFTRLHLEFARRFPRFRAQSFAALLALCVSLGFAWHAVNHRKLPLRVTLLDVGQGESILVQAPSGRTVLIDGGTSQDENRGEVGRAVIVPYLQAQGISKLDAMVLTHADADHCNALPHVVREIPVAFALDGAAPFNQSSTRKSTIVPEYEAVKAAWRERNVTVQNAREGQQLDLDDGVVLTVLAPTEPLLESERGDNNNGAVLRLDYGETSFLFTADIEKEGEERLLRRGANLKCTILKVAHHGSKTSSTPAFLKAANPSVAIVSSGRYNSFGHPAPQTMSNLARQKIPTFRTDVNGAVEVACDAKTCDVQTLR